MEISEKLSELLEKAESEDIFDKAVVGYLLPDGSSHTVTLNTPEDTVFDIASLTKVCPTSTLALSYILEGKLSTRTFSKASSPLMPKSSTLSRNSRQTTATKFAFRTCSRTASTTECR